MRPDEERRDEKRRDEERSDEMRRDKMRRDEERSDETRQGEMRRGEERQDETRRGEMRQVCTQPVMAIRNNGNETQSPGCLQVLVLKRVAGPLLYPTDQADEQVLALFGKKRGA
ncbi:hypothetical protein DPX16_2752 [Anabarilius grahami]|uniref:Uncharacterized protein n=1 Tax=Anabarilius grahami TaxID=495550 RepID=A0A3N0XVC6_ANAGA|nr:hypothetical protein DPX16_2752 [Anabarilius grahami]